MNTLKRKLSSKRGASLLIAMVFMLFCAFVGGSVLASATANAGRVASLAEQQDFLLERSAALLLSDQLRLEEDEDFRLHIVDAHETRQEVIMLDGGGFVNSGAAPVTRRIITFTLFSTDEFVTPMQRLMVESAIQRYLQEKASGEYTVSLRNIYYDVMDGDKVKRMEVSSMDGFWCVPTAEEAASKIVAGTLNVSGTVDQGSPVELPSYQAQYSCSRGAGIYDFNVDFGDLSQLKLRMDGFSGTTSPSRVLAPPVESGSSFVQVTTVSTQTTISWDDPVIEKGGAA